MSRPAMMKKPQQNEIVSMMYGINAKTNEVESVSLTRGGTLSSWRNGSYLTHGVANGRSARAEAALVFNLSDIIELTPLIDDADNPQRAALEEKACQMREGRSR